MSDNIFYTNGDSPVMLQAIAKAQETFKYCWRELSWEARRIVPALDLAYVKIAFVQPSGVPGKPKVEYMWVADIGFDGDLIYGTLINSPGIVNNVAKGDAVEAPLNQLCDWLFASNDTPYGGFSIQVLRSEMDDDERDAHDEAWGLDFAEPDTVFVVRDEETDPAAQEEHPMSINMKDSLRDFLQKNPAEAGKADEEGFTMLHREAIAGNRSTVEALLQAGADKSARTRSGKTALDFARQLNWQHLLPLLQPA
ncbi:DUF2314 domain-containing protein [Chitinophaga caseinilytica]|uniref:DUF2314 domain-containing protein n=1 Tax=Chitinophaga caseinilytica TaxID=2267521 RepID=UPI003C2BB88E